MRNIYTAPFHLILRFQQLGRRPNVRRASSGLNLICVASERNTSDSRWSSIREFGVAVLVKAEAIAFGLCPILGYLDGPEVCKIRSCFKTPQLARYGVINRFKMLIYSHVNCAFSSIYAESRTQLKGFIPMTDGVSGVESALDLSQSKADIVRHSYSYGFRVLTPPCGKGDVLCVLKTHSS